MLCTHTQELSFLCNLMHTKLQYRLQFFNMQLIYLGQLEFTPMLQFFTTICIEENANQT